MKSRISTLLLVACLISDLALAQTGDKAAAETLFNEGRKLMQEGKLDLACDKLAESQRLDPGAGTLLNLADCRERQGRTATAWATWLEAAAAARTAGQGERETLARQRADALRPRLVTLTIEVPESSRVSGLAVTRDGVAVGAAVWGSPVPADPGEHRISASAPGHQTWESPVTIREGSASSVIVPQLTPAAPAPPLAAAPPSSSPAALDAPPAQTSLSAEAGHGPPAMVYVAGIVGVVGFGVGSIYGLRAISKDGESKENSNCTTDTRCNATGTKLREEAFSAARVATVGFIVGGVGVAAATVLWITAPKQESVPPRAGFRVRRVGAQAGPSAVNVAFEGVF